jgi:hypothetical protein
MVAHQLDRLRRDDVCNDNGSFAAARREACPAALGILAVAQREGPIRLTWISEGVLVIAGTRRSDRPARAVIGSRGSNLQRRQRC